MPLGEKLMSYKRLPAPQVLHRSIWIAEQVDLNPSFIWYTSHSQKACRLAWDALGSEGQFPYIEQHSAGVVLRVDATTARALPLQDSDVVDQPDGAIVPCDEATSSHLTAPRGWRHRRTPK